MLLGPRPDEVYAPGWAIGPSDGFQVSSGFLFCVRCDGISGCRSGSRDWLEFFVSRDLGCKGSRFSRDLGEFGVGESEELHCQDSNLRGSPSEGERCIEVLLEPAKDQFADPANINH